MVRVNDSPFAENKRLGKSEARYTVEIQLFPQNPLPAPHGTTRLQIFTGSYWLTTAHYRQITGIYMAFNIKDAYGYRQFTDKAGLFTTDYRR